MFEGMISGGTTERPGLLENRIRLLRLAAEILNRSEGVDVADPQFHVGI
jgi:hypothetical protein